MTKEEAKQVFLSRGYVEVEGGTIYDADKWRESCRVISEWLEQEPCEDAISRQAAQAKIKSICDEYRLSYEDGERKAATGGSAYALGHAFDDLPSVTLQPNIGHWVYDKQTDLAVCNKCGSYSPSDNLGRIETYFCPNCGAKMESEV